MSFLSKRIDQLKYHFLNPKKWIRRFVVIPAGVPSILLGLLSVLFGRDVDIVDRIINSILSKIPIVRIISDSGHGKKHTLQGPRGNTFVVRYEGNGKIKDVGGSGLSSGVYQTSDGEQVTVREAPGGDGYRVSNSSIFESGGGSSGSSSGGISLPGIPHLGGIFKVFAALAFAGGLVFILGNFFAAPDWFSYAGGQFMDRVVVPANIDPEFPVIQQTAAYLSCIGEGPDCYREWQWDNRREPTAESVGETFQVEIDELEMGQGDELPVGYRDPNEEVSLNFNLYNTRSGLEGIDAKDVHYKIAIIDRQRGMDDPYCDSGWRKIEGYDITGDGEENDLYPGAPAGSGFQRLDEITIGNCELQQPAYGEHRTVSLQVKYNYSSLSEVDFEVMSEDVYQQDETIVQDSTDSEALDTPAQAGIRVMRDPVLFSPQAGESNPITFNTQVETEDPDVEFRVRDLEVETPDLAEPAAGETCDFEETEEGYLELSEDAKDRIIPTEEGVETYGDDFYWFDDSTDMVGCNLDFENVDTLTETGETFSLSARTNYTVKITEQRENFYLYNQACEAAGAQCPMLVTEDWADESEYEWRTECEGLDAGTGCSVIDGDTYGTTNEVILPANEDDITGLDSHLSRGEVALDPSELDFIIEQDGDNDEGVIYNDKFTDREMNDLAIGLTSDELTRIRTDHSWVITTFRSGNVQSISSDVQDESDLDMDDDQWIAMFPDPN